MRPSDLAAVVRVRSELRCGAARAARIAADISAAEMARALGVSRTTIGDWESGRRRPTDEHALAYGRMLGQFARMAA